MSLPQPHSHVCQTGKVKLVTFQQSQWNVVDVVVPADCVAGKVAFSPTGEFLLVSAANGKVYLLHENEHAEWTVTSTLSSGK